MYVLVITKYTVNKILSAEFDAHSAHFNQKKRTECGISCDTAYLVVGVRHGVEWPGCQGELVQDVEVSVILQQQNFISMLEFFFIIWNTISIIIIQIIRNAMILFAIPIDKSTQVSLTIRNTEMVFVRRVVSNHQELICEKYCISGTEVTYSGRHQFSLR